MHVKMSMQVSILLQWHGEKQNSGIPRDCLSPFTKILKDDQIRYMTHQKVAGVIREAVKAVYPNMPKETLLKYSCHSIRVWACVCLDEVGKPPDFIKKRLRWVGESYRVYLRDTNKINEQHRDALRASLEATLALIEHVEDVVLEELLPEDAHQASWRVWKWRLIWLSTSVFVSRWCFQIHVNSGFCLCAASLHTVTIPDCTSRWQFGLQPEFPQGAN